MKIAVNIISFAIIVATVTIIATVSLTFIYLN